MATHSSVLAWRIPGMGSHRIGHDRSDLAAGGNLSFIFLTGSFAFIKGTEIAKNGTGLSTDPWRKC